MREMGAAVELFLLPSSFFLLPPAAGATMSQGGGSNGPVPPAPGGEGGAVRRTVRILNPLGLHHRVADRFARTAKGFPAVAVTVWNADQQADGKSVWDLLGLVAMPGAEVVLEVAGPDAPAAADALAAVLAAPGGEDYTI